MLPTTPTHDLGEIRDGTDYNSRHLSLLLLVRGSSFTREEAPRWLEHLDDENWDVVEPGDIESWLSQDLLETCASVEPVSEFDFCQIGMTAIVMGDVNAVFTLERAHRRQLLAVRALNGRSLWIRGPPFPRTKTMGDVFIDDLVILSVLQFSDVPWMSIRRPSKCSVPTLCTISSTRPRMRASLAVHWRESSGEDTSTALQALLDSLSTRC